MCVCVFLKHTLKTLKQSLQNGLYVFNFLAIFVKIWALLSRSIINIVFGLLELLTFYKLLGSNFYFILYIRIFIEISEIISRNFLLWSVWFCCNFMRLHDYIFFSEIPFDILEPGNR